MIDADLDYELYETDDYYDKYMKYKKKYFLYIKYRINPSSRAFQKQKQRYKMV